MGKHRPEEEAEVKPGWDTDARHTGRSHDPGDLDRDPHADAKSRALATQEATRGGLSQGAHQGGQPQAAPGGGVAPQAPLPGLTKSTTAPAGKRFAHLDEIDPLLIPPEYRPSDPTTKLSVALLVDGDVLIVHVAVGTEHWIASLSGSEAVEALSGKNAAAKVGSASEFLRKLGTLDLATRRVRINLFGTAPNDSFVVLDLLRIAKSVGRGTLDGLRPVEAQLILADGKDNNVAGARLFSGSGNVKGITGNPIGGWFPLPNIPEVRAALGPQDDEKAALESLVGGAFYADGVLQVAVKESEAATTGLVAHINLGYLAERLKAFGDKIVQWVEALLKKIASGAANLFKSVSLGKLRLELPDLPSFKGIWFDFDFNLTLPRLFRGGGGGGFDFDLSGLWPTGFNFDFGGFSLGAMPKLSLPWLRAPKLGSFDVPWERLKGLLPDINLPSLSMPKLPAFNFGFHRIGGLKFGFGTDLSLAWPELGDLSLGFTLDLEKILEKLAALGKWLLRKLKAAGDFINRWIHFGSDGVLRIYDAHRPDGPMVGFHLLKLLDGAQATDLAPTEMRWTEGAAGIAMELGEAEDEPAAGADDKGEKEKGKGTPDRPGGILLTEKKGIDAPDSLEMVMSLAPGAKIDVSLHADGDHIVVFSEAPSTLYEKGQALRTSLNVKMLARRVIEKWPAAHGKPPRLDRFQIDINPAHTKSGPRVNFQLPSAVGMKGGSGYALWKLEDLLRAKDWTDLAPSELQLSGEGVGGVQLGELSYADVGPVIGQRFDFQSKKLASKLLRDDDDTVWAGLHKKGDVIGVSLTKEEDGKEGALAHVHLSFLLDKLKKFGELGRKALEYLADLHMPEWRSSGGRSDIFAKAAELAERIGNAFLKLVDGILELKLPTGGFIRWNLKAQLPRLGVDLDLGDIIPEFDLTLPGMPTFSFAFLPSASFGNALGGLSFKLPNLGLRDLLGQLPNIKLPKGDFDVNLSWVGDLLGVSIHLGDLFGSGDMSLGFKLPIESMLDKLRKIGKWLGKVPGKVKDLANHLHLGSDGVLRIFDPENPSARVGFDLKKLFDGVDPDDLVPVEAHAEVKTTDNKTLAEVSYGDAYVSQADKRDAKLPDANNKGGGKHVGAVLVPRPKGTAVENVTFTAPAWLQDHLSAPENARVHASLYMPSDKTAAMVTLFAVVDGSDRGVEVRINVGELASRGKLPPGSDKGISINRQASMGRGMLVLGVKTDKVSGHAGWKLSSLLDTPSLESLLPDELVLERDEGKLTIGSEIDVSKLHLQGEFDLGNWEVVASRLPGKSKVAVYTNDFEKAEPRIALVVPDEKDTDGKRPGIELQLDRKFVVSLNTKLRKLAKRVRSSVGSALSRSEDAREQSVPRDLHVYATTSGVMVERGKAGDEWHLYAKWGWQDLGQLMEGEVTLDNLLPHDFRVATGALSVEVTDLAIEKGKELPRGAKQVKELHALLKDTLHTFGVGEDQYIDLALQSPETKVVDEEKQLIRIHGAIYDADAAGKIQGGKSLDLDVSLQALIAQVLPQRQRAWSKKKPRDPNRKFHVTGGIDVHRTDGQADGIDLHAGVERENAKGNQTKFEVRVGWSFDQILNMLMNLDQMITEDGKPSLSTAAGLLTPKRIGGEVETDDFRVEFGNDGHASSMNTSVENIPALGPLLGLVLDPATVAAARLHLNLPSREAFTKSFDEATAKIKRGEVDYKLPIGDCAIELPIRNSDDLTAEPASKFYQITLSVSPLKFKSLLQLIPGIGQYIKIADLVVGVLQDPKGALEGAMYTPEALYMVVSNAGEMWGAIKEKGWKGVAMAMFVNGDMSTKQGVMAGRIYAKMKAANWTKKGDKIPDIAGVDPEYLTWLAAQDGDKLVALQRLSEEMDAMGLGDALEKEKPTIPAGGLPDVETINLRITEIEAGYAEFAKVQETAGTDQAAVDAAADNLRKRIEKAIQAGAKPSGGVDMSDKATSKDKPTQTEDREFSDISDLPLPEDDQAKMARDIFDVDKDGAKDKDVVVVTMEDAQYLVNKYSSLSTEQLGDMLANGHAKVATKDGEREMPMHEEERGFVRTLFLRRLAAEGVELKKGQAGGAGSDADLVTAYRAAKARAERAEKRGKGANDASGQKGTGQGDSDKMSYEDGDGTGGTLDDVFGDGAEKGEAEGEGKDASDGASEAGVENEQGKAEDGSGDETGGQEEEPEEPKTLKDRFRPGFHEARAWVSFDTTKNTATLNQEAIQNYLGAELPFQGAMYRIDEIALAGYTPSGAGEDQIFEFTIEIKVTSDATHRIPSLLNYTFIYTPSEDKISAYGGMTDPVGWMQKMNDAVDILGENSGQVSANARFTHEGWELEVLRIVQVTPRNISQVWAKLQVQFHKIPQPSVTVKTPEGPRLVRAPEIAELELPLMRDKK